MSNGTEPADWGVLRPASLPPNESTAFPWGSEMSTPLPPLNFNSTPISGATGGPVSVGGLNAPAYPFPSGWPATGAGSVLSGNALSISNGAVIAVAVVAGVLLLAMWKTKG